jgi:RNA polymerase sigma-70 factor (ECF subfamily)
VAESESLFVYRALVAGEPTAPRRFIEMYNGRLYALLRRRYSFLPGEVVRDAAHDALLAVIAHPERYAPEYGSLMNYMVHIGSRRLQDYLRTLRRRLDHEVQVEDVELLSGLTNQETGADGDPEVLPPEVEALIQEILPDPTDRRVWNLICQGRTARADYAEALAVTHLPLSEQELLIKRHRDRVQKRMRRRQDEFRRLLL